MTGGRPGEGEIPASGTPAPNGKRYESVWDYPRPPRLEPVEYTIEVVHNGVTVARSARSLRVCETSQPPAYYLPADDIDMSLFRSSATVTFCEWKGVAAYADLSFDEQEGAGAAPVSDAAWTYPTPTDPFGALAGHWAFYAQKLDRCLVDGEAADPNEGRFYGGWITSNITGPFKGGPGTSHW